MTMQPNTATPCAEEESKTDLIAFDQIIYCKAHGNYTMLYLIENKRLFLCKLLKYLERKLPCTTFIRIHRSIIINKNFVLHVKGNNRVVLKDNIELFISKRRRQKVFSELSDFHISFKM
jgi:two-component system LytT family response regulator